ncbi:MAG TPA: lactate racemase domain-containing protein [Ruminiclostridium sp.]
MTNIIEKSNRVEGISKDRLIKILRESLAFKAGELKKVLIIPPDYTRKHSEAGVITAIYYELLKDICEVDIMPAVGSHFPMTDYELTEMFGTSIPFEKYLEHNWKTDAVKIGQVPADYIRKISGGSVDYSIDVEVDKKLLDKSYDLILSIGQVVPHEVVGMANYSKNVFVGCGGRDMINATHYLGAICGLEEVIGKDFAPVRKVFDYCEENFLKDVPIMYVMTVTSPQKDFNAINGIFIGKERKVFEEAVAQSRELNITIVDQPLKKVVVYLDPHKFRSTWVGNKAVYRTRMAIADQGELLVLAPGISQYGEDPDIDRMIGKYGYSGTENVLRCVAGEELGTNLAAAAHLIHGSSEGRFSITYAVENLTREQVEKINYKYMPLSEAYEKYKPNMLKDGFNTMEDGEVIYYISSPASGLWSTRERWGE